MPKLVTAPNYFILSQYGGSLKTTADHYNLRKYFMESDTYFFNYVTEIVDIVYWISYGIESIYLSKDGTGKISFIEVFYKDRNSCEVLTDAQDKAKSNLMHLHYVTTFVGNGLRIAVDIHEDFDHNNVRLFQHA